MNFSKLAAAAALAGCASFSAFASSTKPVLGSNCQTISITPQAGQVELYLSKENAFIEDKKPFTILGYLPWASGDTFDTSGIKVEVLKQSKIDSFQKGSYGWKISTTDVTVYGVKLRISAPYVIGFEIQGDVGVSVTSLEVFTICSDSSKYIGQPKK